MDMQLRVIKRGDDCFSAKDYDQAIAEYSKAIELNPRYALAYAKRAIAYAAKSKRARNTLLDSARDALASAQPWRAMELTNTAALQKEIIEPFHRALDDFETAIKLNPKDAVTYYNRGSVYTEEFKRTPASPSFVSALADLSRAIKLNKGFAEAYYNRGYLYSLVEDDKRALSDFSEAIRLAPHDTQSLSARGLLYAAQGRFDKALDDFNRIVSFDPGDPQAYYYRGAIHKDKGERALAVSDFKKVLELSRDDSLRQEAEDRLQELGM